MFASSCGVKSRIRGGATNAIASNSAGAGCFAFANAFTKFASPCGRIWLAKSKPFAASASQTCSPSENPVVLTTLAAPYATVATVVGSRRGTICSVDSSNDASALL